MMPRLICACLLLPMLGIFNLLAFAECPAEWEWAREHNTAEECDFIKEIKQAFIERDKEKLLSFFPDNNSTYFGREDELKRGPRKRYLERNSFTDVFPEDYRQLVIDSKPEWVHECPLCFAHIHVSQRESNFIISAIDGGYVPEKFSTDDLPVGWVVEGHLLSPGCFSRPWISGDNYQELGVYGHREQNIGELLGTIPMTIPWPWEFQKDHPPTLSLVADIETCNENHPEPKYSDRTLMYYFKDTFHGYDAYEVIDVISTEACKSLAPNLNAKCLESVVIHCWEATGGSMGDLHHYTIYGLFEMPDGKKIVAPLRHDLENSIRNIVEDLKAEFGE